jgi:hypothetical protein
LKFQTFKSDELTTKTLCYESLVLNRAEYSLSQTPRSVVTLTNQSGAIAQ